MITIGVIGAGQMGRGIAQVAASVGFQTKIYDTSTKSLHTGMSFIEGQFKRGLQKAKWNEDFVHKALSRLRPVESIELLKDVDIAIEAATENKNIKFDIFRKLDLLVSKSCILASNTSSISITEIGAQTNNPHRVVGMHFMNPVPVMKLVEGIRGLETSPEAFVKVKEIAEAMNKTFIEVNDTPGFLINRILLPMINEAVYALFEGVANIQDIDNGMKLGANWPMGPLSLADFIGLDTCLAIMEILYDGLGDSKYRPCPLLKKYVAAGRLGKKAKKGFYNYE